MLYRFELGPESADWYYVEADDMEHAIQVWKQNVEVTRGNYHNIGHDPFRIKTISNYPVAKEIKSDQDDLSG